jgi:DNA polymerase-3 subunit delta
MIRAIMVYTLAGKNTFQLSKHLDSVMSTFLKEHGDLGLERIDASEKDTDIVFQAVQSLPFLANRKLVIIKNSSSNVALLERLAELVERVPESIDVYFVDQNFDKRKSYYKLLKSLTTLTEFAEQRPQDIAMWISGAIKERGGTISRPDAQLLVDRIGSSQQKLSQEIDKLLLYQNNVTRESIELLTDQSIQSTVFALLDAAFQGNGAKALKLYREQRSAKVDPNYIVAMLTWQLQALALAVYAEPQSETTLLAAGQSPFSARKSLQLAKSISRKRLEQYVVTLSEIDAKTKSSAVDADAALELFFVELTTSS